MAKKSRKASRFAPLQELTLVPITDPAKQAALEERLRRGREAAPVRTRGNVNTSESNGTAAHFRFEQRAPLTPTRIRASKTGRSFPIAGAMGGCSWHEAFLGL
jgi:hypothetical protein